MSEDVRHPTLQQFQRALDTGQADREKAAAFDKWRSNPGKCTGPLKEAADALWRRYEALDPSQRVGVKMAPFDYTQPQQQRGGARPPGGRAPQGERATAGPAPRRGDNSGAAAPSVLDESFHNPYTFLPFPAAPPNRRPPTPLTVDEEPSEAGRFTGVLELTVRTLSPLLTCSPQEENPGDPHKRYRALVIDRDVIVPASGIRGALRSLLSVVTGGTLGYLDDGVWLCQGRDKNLGPAGQSSPPGTPQAAHLARVVQPGSHSRAGTVALGVTRLVKADDLERGKKLSRPTAKAAEPLWCDDASATFNAREDAAHPWQVKLSGRPIISKGKREGLFRANGVVVELPAKLWAEYQGRHRHGVRPELRAGDLVWIEPTDPTCTKITSAADARSIQWARWGREGERLLDIVRDRHPSVLPDSFNPDGLVDEVTDLFGQVPRPELAREAFPDWKAPSEGRPGPAGPFSGRVRPENLVFFDVVGDGVEHGVPMAPLQPPHPGCAAFYRDVDSPDLVANHKLPLRGYKVYRTTKERGAMAPWLFQTQGVYGEKGELNHPQQRVNKTCDLVKEGREGRLSISCRALSVRELGLLLAACSVDWRLGGGKPLGLGLCRVTEVRAVNELGAEVLSYSRSDDRVAVLPEPYAAAVSDVEPRLKSWQASQEPVQRLRYPRAVSENNNRKQRGGHAWFQRHAQPRKVDRGEGHPVGLQVTWAKGDLQKKAGGVDRIAAQVLPKFSDGQDDLLYGYDLIAPGATVEQERDRVSKYSVLEPFDPQRHARDEDQSGGSQTQNRETREDGRRSRK